jgi:hypothetical protein
MFDGLVDTKISGNSTITAKRHITDEETLTEMEFAGACDERWFTRRGHTKVSGQRQAAKYRWQASSVLNFD